jgi:rhodanese-related sulfurtransferase
MNTISPEEAHEKQKNQHCPLIDVREPLEYRQQHAVGAELYPIDRLEGDGVLDRTDFGVNKDEDILVICQHGGRSNRVAEMLERKGYTNVSVVEGGTSAWAEAGLPTRDEEVMDLKRQTYIAAGSIVVFSVIMSILRGRLWDLVTLGIGGGLIYGGITGDCRMSKILAQLPINQ